MVDRRPFVVLLVGLWVGLLAGCPDKKPKYPVCGTDADCKEGQHCVNKMCVECAEDSHCPEGQTCVSGGCQPAEDACTSDDQCDEGQVCKNGRCSACTDNAECGPGGKCQSGVCQRAKVCKVDEDCADDEDCIDGRCQQPWKGNGAGITCELKTVHFEFDRAVIAAEHRDTLNENAECIRQARHERGVSLHGHADEIGTEEYNIALSERRGQAVADYLARLGIDPARLYVIPKGETEPTGRGPEADRRVEFEWR
jgi:peptidoglycan-associated lipoprotein